ncbi:MAG: Nodulation efficiency, NfeD [Candidatus Amesbacteria bacterium GW2011_GWA1_47_16]|uniref:Nodulation efficiency, NfeD n=1 Tax=Candidatus Amesbacteria bacterium GW2011_GWA1_47_16 TaxID=1618353 RepID=A0A0G1S2D6_9BACT|nr:MAG: Nodulation efficiency, NfeD [Candidatus Amesbacteria bacterium GW2011_GWA1_47_16]
MWLGQDTNNWIILFGLLMVAVELFLGVQMGFDFVLIGSILIISGALGSVTGSVVLALNIAIVLSVLYIAFGRNAVKRRIIVMTHKTNIDKLVGSKGTVIRSLTPDTAGMVRVEDEDWRAVSDEVLYEKDKVEVLGLSGVTLKVKKISS